MLQAGDPHLVLGVAKGPNLANGTFALTRVWTCPPALSDGFPFTAYSAKSHPVYAAKYAAGTAPGAASTSMIVTFNTNSATLHGVANSTVGYHPRFLQIDIIV